MKNGKLSITAVLWLFGLIPMLLVAFGTGTKSITTISQELTTSTVEKLTIASKDLGNYYENELAQEGEIAYSTDYVDKYKTDDIELTLFIGDTRFATSITDASGKRNEGTKADAEIFATVSSGKSVTAQGIDIGGRKYFVHYEPYYDAQGQFYGMAFSGTPEDDFNRVLRSAIVSSMLIVLSTVLIAVVLVYIFATKIKKNMGAAAKALETLAGGDITSKVEESNSIVKEIQLIGNASMTLQQKLSASIGGVKSAADNLDSSVETVDNLSEDSANGAKQIREAVNGLSATAQTMASTLMEANENIIDMGDNISKISEKIRGVADNAGNMLGINDETMQYMNKVQISTERAVEAIGNIGRQTNDTNGAVERIKSAAEIIAEIANQTNLLALNASIEAARAGEAGKGFAVVADSIKQLAEQSAESANSIQDVVNEIVSLSAGSVDLTNETVQIIKEQESCINDSVEKISILNEAVKLIAENIEAVDIEIEGLDKTKESVLGNISDLSAIAEENAASSEEVTANVESIADGIEGTKDQSKEMRDMASDLIKQIRYFH